MARSPTPPETSDTNAGEPTLKPVEKQVVEKFIVEKIPIKENAKLEKIETKEHKDAKVEKLEKNEAKEVKDSKVEKAEKNEAKEHKDAKIEKIEHKELVKVEQLEKTIVEQLPGGGPVENPMEQRVAALEQAVANLQHFIPADQRPDLSRGALSGESRGSTS